MESILLERYGDLRWWPANEPFEVAVGAILTQNTSWRNVEVALDALRENGTLTPHRLVEVDVSELEALIRPSGFFRQKARYLKHLATYVQQSWSGDIMKMSAEPLADVRRQLLALPGVGPETADSIMLYALRMPSFVVDAYTFRLLRRTGICHEQKYKLVKTAFEEALGADVDRLANAHAMVVVHCKNVCKVKPLCSTCPLRVICSEAKEHEEGVAYEGCQNHAH